jgi:glycine cleavage system H protein
MEFPKDRLYSECHLWVKSDTGHSVIGITDHAKEELGSVDYVELPASDDSVAKNMPFGIIETSKAVTDLIAPISGIVVKINDALLETADALTEDPYNEGWLIAVEPSEPSELEQLMTWDRYSTLVADLNDEKDSALVT